MSNQWFRMYAEFASDAKVQMMPENYQRRLLMLMCLRCNGDVTLQDVEAAFQLRISNDEWAETKRDFIARGFIDSSNNLLNWDKRQYRSDSSAERVRKHREAKRSSDVTLCNVTVTPPDTDTESNPLTPLGGKADGFEDFWKLFPKQRAGSKAKAHAAYRQALKRASHDEIMGGLKAYAVSDEVARGYAKGASAWLNDDRWTCDYGKSGGGETHEAGGEEATCEITREEYDRCKRMLEENPYHLNRRGLSFRIKAYEKQNPQVGTPAAPLHR